LLLRGGLGLRLVRLVTLLSSGLGACRRLRSLLSAGLRLLLHALDLAAELLRLLTQSGHTPLQASV
jgi:hypothetical protein